MKILKWILIVVVVIVGLFLAYSASQPDHLAVEESILIDAPPSAVFAEISDYNNWKAWSAWDKLDSNMIQEYTGDQGTVGYTNTWKSNVQEVGNGRQEIVEIEENKMLKSKMNFEGWDADNFATFNLEEIEGGKTKVTWDMNGAKTPFYMNFINGLMKPTIVKSYQTSLANLKTVVESKPREVANPMNLEVVDLEPVKIVSIKDSTDAMEISKKLAELYTELSIYMEMNNIKMVEMPLAFYYSYSEDKVILEAAMQYEGEAKPEGRIMVKETPAGKTIKGIHYGDYASSGEMHAAIENYGEAASLRFKDICWEIYANDPTMVDSAAVETHIFYPVN
jgi:effector-binding domain-containing protein/uncharacterized protein YndB with AHSA1/START domain